ncbi:MAG: DNA double-strand break repair nuclease NurA [Blastocatellia bacterium]|jgi:hypothetical protein
MLLPEEVLTQLRRRWPEWKSHEDGRRAELRLYGEAWERLTREKGQSIREWAERSGGRIAWPIESWEGRTDLELHFAHHEAARTWAGAQLGGKVTLAVDGSQIPPLAEIGLPIAALQVALFENPHTAAGQFRRTLTFELLSPEELPAEVSGDPGELRPSIDQWINLRRFELEVSTLAQRLHELSPPSAGSLGAIAFFDSPLSASFAERQPDALRQRYERATELLLKASRESGIPVIGYIDLSRARDLVRLLESYFGLPPATRITDAELLQSAGRLGWGARLPLLNLPSSKREELGFVYLQTTGTGPPARLEIPRWVGEAGFLDELIAIVLAEVIVGNGFPYPIESADAAAALTAHDRDRFVALVQQVAEANGHPLAVSLPAKARSKARRR